MRIIECSHWKFCDLTFSRENPQLGWEAIKKTRIYNGLLLSHKKNEIVPLAATWMDLEIVILSDISQALKDKHRVISLICGI